MSRVTFPRPRRALINKSRFRFAAPLKTAMSRANVTTNTRDVSISGKCDGISCFRVNSLSISARFPGSEALHGSRKFICSTRQSLCGNCFEKSIKHYRDETSTDNKKAENSGTVAKNFSVCFLKVCRPRYGKAIMMDN